MLLETLHHQKDAIDALGLQYGARRIRVFGSVARGEETLESDIDPLSIVAVIGMHLGELECVVRIILGNSHE